MRKNDNYLELYPGFLTGDFNGSPADFYYEQIIQYYDDSRNTAITNSSAVDYTYQNYGKSERLLDHCFHSPGNVTILDYRILDDLYGGYISDHFGILVTALLN